MITPGDGDPRHGTVNGYNNLRCRCTECRGAHADYHYTLLQANPKILPPGDPRHGSSSAYRWWGCRCSICKAGNAAASRDYWNRRGRKESRP